jgi:hypothetical protein
LFYSDLSNVDNVAKLQAAAENCTSPGFSSSQVNTTLPKKHKIFLPNCGYHHNHRTNNPLSLSQRESQMSQV